MPASVPSPEALDAARQQGDAQVRELIEKLEGRPDLGPGGYNLLLGTMDVLVRAPELLAKEDSSLSRALAAAPPEFRDYFDPQPLPEWVDEAQLGRAAAFWEENTITLLFVLYVASLPACYLLHRGIPALYRSRKLAKRQYLPQRLYETGLMLDAVLDADGLLVRRDLGTPPAQLLAQALTEAGLAETWKWDATRRQLVRVDGQPGAMASTDEARLRAVHARVASRGGGKAYVVGRGVLAARKVRFLHGYMRHLLMRPPPGEGAPEWNSAELGAPVNQEDLAYTLLTFGYVMPAALMKLGVDVTPEERAAFLHRWRLVGHLMGVDDALLVSRWEDAAALYQAIQDREAGPSAEGRELTTTLLGFLEEFLPTFLGIHRRLPVQFVTYLLGPRADDVLSDEYRRRRRSLLGKLMFLGMWVFLRAYFGVEAAGRKLLGGVPIVATHGLHVLGEALIESFRAAFERKPFYLPENLTHWQRAPGDTKSFESRLHAWRLRLVNTVLLAVAFWIAGTMLLFTALLLGGFARWQAAGLTGVGGLVAYWIYGALVDWCVPALRSRRPEPEPAGPITT